MSWPGRQPPASVRSFSSISLSRQRVRRAAARGLRRDAVLLAVPGPEIHFHGDRRDRGIACDLDLAAHLEDRRVVDAGVGELIEAGLAQHQRGGDRMLQAHLALTTGRDVGPVRPLQQQRVAADGDPFDGSCGIVASPVERAVEQGMDDEAGRIGLDRIIVLLPRSCPGRRRGRSSSGALPSRRGNPARRRSARPGLRSPFPPAMPTTSHCVRHCRR